MTKKEQIKKIAEPILNEIKKMEEKNKDDNLAILPQIHFVYDASNSPKEIDGIQIDEEFITELEHYIQEEIEMMHMPTILH